MSVHCTLGYAPFLRDAAIPLEATLVIVPRDLLITDTRFVSTRTNAQTPMAAVTRCVRTTQEVTDAPASMGLCYSLTGNHAKISTNVPGIRSFVSINVLTRREATNVPVHLVCGNL